MPSLRFRPQSGIGLLSAAAFDVYSNWEMPRSVMVARESSMERAFGLATPAMAGRYHAHQHGFSADRH